ncbi:hypothetical protein M7I_4455 [Glarea lozoyensis 74030]|uniref:Uncharacterized protein n=1 Tax=Glarea lozoyensis (strain ATCC 74030 / MF5533) TaxID=1104152 RepID=H0EP84_GLAL7|nr:hypothetical protein M7I_4455 [Glarea lozoyensis 74030]
MANAIFPSRTQPQILDFTDSLQEFHQNLIEVDGVGSDEDFAVRMTEIILRFVKNKIMPCVGREAALQTKVNALHVLMDIALGIAHAPPAPVSELMRRGTAPPSLVTTMYDVLSEVRESEKMKLAREHAFMRKVKALRAFDREDSAVPVWKGLDEVLRLLGFEGTVDFRFCYDAVWMLLNDEKYAGGACINTGSVVLRIVRNDIAGFVSAKSTFETKIYALNALADIGMALLHGRVSGDDGGVVEITLVNSILKVANLLEEKDIEIVSNEMRALAPEMPPEVCDNAESMTGPRRDRVHRILMDTPHVRKHSPITNALFAKFLHLRWSPRSYVSRWTTALRVLDRVIDIFIECPVGTVPLSCNRLVETVNDEFMAAKTSHSAANNSDIRNIVDRTIQRLAKRGSGKACAATKVNVLRALFQIGMRILQWRRPGNPSWMISKFQDQHSETLVTSAYLAICRSFSKEEWSVVKKNPGWAKLA